MYSTYSGVKYARIMCCAGLTDYKNAFMEIKRLGI